jgi:hypothetical protein
MVSQAIKNAIHRKAALKRMKKKPDFLGDVGHVFNLVSQGKIGEAGHHVNKKIGYKNAQTLKNLGKDLLYDRFRKGVQHLTGVKVPDFLSGKYFGKKTLPKGPNFPKKVTNKSKTGNVNKHKYKKGTMML